MNNTVGTTTAATTPEAHQQQQEQQDSVQPQYAPLSSNLLPPHRVSPSTTNNTYLGRMSMLSRDDSLINLAMLPMLDTVDADVLAGGGTGGGGVTAPAAAAPESVSSTSSVTGANSNSSTNGLGNTSDNITLYNYNNNTTSIPGGGGNSTLDYISAMFSRENSLINLLATVDGGSGGDGTNATRQQQQQQQQPLLDCDQDGWGGGMFGFIDFQNVG
jgi:hypothetical protein